MPPTKSRPYGSHGELAPYYADCSDNMATNRMRSGTRARPASRGQDKNVGAASTKRKGGRRTSITKAAGPRKTTRKSAASRSRTSTTSRNAAGTPNRAGRSNSGRNKSKAAK